MYTLIYILLTVFVTWKVAKIFFIFKYKYDVKFIKAVMDNEPLFEKFKKKEKVIEVKND